MRSEKKYLISEVETHLKKSDYVILANFSKITVADTAELRSRLAPEQAEFHVVKNSSFKVAAKALGLPEVDSALAGQTAIIVGGKNPAGGCQGAEEVRQRQAEARSEGRHPRQEGLQRESAQCSRGPALVRCPALAVPRHAHAARCVVRPRPRRQGQEGAGRCSRCLIPPFNPPTIFRRRAGLRRAA